MIPEPKCKVKVVPMPAEVQEISDKAQLEIE